MAKNIPLNSGSSSFKPLALKYRPGRFADVVGQEAVSRVLLNAVKSGQVHSAYLFHGSRGSGKTSIARIFARALNCGKRVADPKKYDGEPCTECVSCQDIATGRSLDVMEIDAASHTSVENVREAILDTVKLAPARDPYRVFIIDEVHMLSTSAFNAMLKTLEEPPNNMVFILATTEFVKVPATIVSRTHSFLFRPLSAALVEERLKSVASKEGVKIAPEALKELARASSGSLRDALSLLQQAANLMQGEGEIKRADVIRLLGLVSDEVLEGMMEAIVKTPDAGRLKELVEECLYKSGYSAGQVAGALHAQCAEALIRSVEKPDPALPVNQLYRLERYLASLLKDIRFAPDPLLTCEAGLLGYVLRKDEPVETVPVAVKPAAAAPAVKVVPVSASAPAPVAAPAAKAAVVKPAPAPAKPAKTAPTASEPAPAPIPGTWQEKTARFMEAIRAESFEMYFRNCFVRDGDPAVLEFPDLFSMKGAEMYKDKVFGHWKKYFTDKTLAFKSRGDSTPLPPTAREGSVADPSELPDDVKQIAELFGGKVKKKPGF